MQHLKIITIGKLKKKYWTAACQEYLKRLQPMCKIEIIEVPEVQIPQNASYTQIQNALNEEGDLILSKLGRKESSSYIVALCVEGQKTSSEDFAKKLESLSLGGKSNLFFIIGGSNGLSDKVKEASDYRLSFSDMTFPHQLMRVILIEQIYRAFKINRNETYHK